VARLTELEKHQGSEGKMNLKSEVAERLHQEGERMGTPKTLVLFVWEQRRF
jgi:hypothetical protein